MRSIARGARNDMKAQADVTNDVDKCDLSINRVKIETFFLFRMSEISRSRKNKFRIAANSDFSSYKLKMC